MGYIKNRDQLLDHGCRPLREMVLQLIEQGIARADPYLAVKKLVHLDGHRLRVGRHDFDLRKAGNIYVVGAGKATFPIARALDEILGKRINRGIVVCKCGQEGLLEHVEVRLAGHPVPDEAGFAAAGDILDLARKTRPGDIVFAAFTGGSSALMPYPPEGITLEEKRSLTRLLLYSSANIAEINSIRKHLSRIKGGRLARAINSRASIINLTVSDVIGDALDCITCPTVPDTSTIAQARTAMTRYGLWEKAAPSICGYLGNFSPEQESPKDLSDHQIHDFIVVPGTAACDGAYEGAGQMGPCNRMILSTMLEGEGREVGGTFADIAKEIALRGNPIAPPCVVIGGGENTVAITEGRCGQGGPNQEFALGAALRLENIHGVVIAGLDTDGTDGPTRLAGAIVDSSTAARAASMGIDLYKALREHDVSPALKALGDAIVTGTTGTNVNDLKVMAVRSCG